MHSGYFLLADVFPLYLLVAPEEVLVLLELDLCASARVVFGAGFCSCRPVDYGAGGLRLRLLPALTGAPSLCKFERVFILLLFAVGLTVLFAQFTLTSDPGFGWQLGLFDVVLSLNGGLPQFCGVDAPVFEVLQRVLFAVEVELLCEFPQGDGIACLYQDIKGY